MDNLKQETLNMLEANLIVPERVRWVGSRDGQFAISWEQFLEIADFNYDDGYGAQEIATDLVVVGDGWWLERHEYDGSEWWEFKSLPIRKEKAREFDNVTPSYGRELERANTDN